LINNYQENEVKDLGGAQDIFDGFDVNVIKVGLPKHEFFTQKVTGALFNEDGTYAGPELLEDANGQPLRVSFGNPVPNYTGSFSLNFRLFKNANVYLLTDWATGLSVFNSTNTFAYSFGNNPRFNELATQLGIAGTDLADGIAFFSEPVEGVTPLNPGTSEYNAAAEEFARLDWTVNGNFVEDADYFKVREISVSYSLRDLLPKIGGVNNYLKDMVIALSATNVFMKSKYSGPDPEVNFRGSRDLTRGQDFLTLMQPRTYNVSFRFSL
jgi:hypothetical protein